ncbi:MAG: metal-dependent hydrolase, partial [Jatrophihabitantaceae bacterium]
MAETNSPPSATVEVRRSARRRRTVSAYRDGERIVVLIPARFTRAEEAQWV